MSLLTYLFLVFALAATMQAWRMYIAERKKAEAKQARFQAVKDLLFDIKAVDDRISLMRSEAGLWPLSEACKSLVVQRISLHDKFMALVGIPSTRETEYMNRLITDVLNVPVSTK